MFSFLVGIAFLVCGIWGYLDSNATHKEHLFCVFAIIAGLLIVVLSVLDFLQPKGARK